VRSVSASRRAAACFAIWRISVQPGSCWSPSVRRHSSRRRGLARTCINWQFAQAGPYEDHSSGDDQFSFAYPTVTDPISGRTDGILQRARDHGVCPKVSAAGSGRLGALTGDPIANQGGARGARSEGQERRLSPRLRRAG
jgi:hypothetical protein